MIFRALAGAVLAGALALAARRARSLSTSGAVAAVGVGSAAAAAGWSWAATLIAFFVASTMLTRHGRTVKEARVGAIVEKGGERDAVQVLANGGIFAVTALGSVVLAEPALGTAAFGSLAAVTSDTWATEIGTLAGRRPRSILSMRPVPPGTSGGMTAAGTFAAAAGAAFIGTAALLAGSSPATAMAALVGGVTGSFADSVLGATVQERRWCDRCGAPTERLVHSCGTPTRVVGGVRGLRNDLVNFLCSVVGAAIAGSIAR